MSVLAAVLIVLGTALYLVVREQLLGGVDNGVKLVAAQRSRDSGSPNGTRTSPGSAGRPTRCNLS